MTTPQAIVLGVIQGLTEFLPVSSSGHLALAQMIMGVEPSVTFALGVHAGTALAVLALYGRDAWGIIVGLFRGISYRDGSARMALCLVLTSIPAAIVGLAASDAVEAAFSSPMFVAIGLMISGAVLWVTGGRAASPGRSARRRVTSRTITYGHALGVGAAQAIAVFPGVSRSGMTISGALGLGFDRTFAAAYSFIASLPVILGAVALWPISNPDALASLHLPSLAVGAVASFVSGIAAMLVLRSIVQHGKLRKFSYYLWAVGLAVILWETRGLWP
ncbi:MAG: Undecaprenyl-diphosphatase [Firmicutes bacterium ADurb.BinA052]|nr:MAG: Undecaprenyl-diphosphatase [Firmicutes bacterium ADurb.BinA052]